MKTSFALSKKWFYQEHLFTFVLNANDLFSINAHMNWWIWTRHFFLNYTKAAYKQHFHSMRRRHQTQQRHSSNLSPELFQWQAPGRLNKKQVHDRAPCGNSTSCLGMGGWRTCSGELAQSPWRVFLTYGNYMYWALLTLFTPLPPLALVFHCQVVSTQVLSRALTLEPLWSMSTGSRGTRWHTFKCLEMSWDFLRCPEMS